MRFVYYTDPHIRGTNPKSRKDFFPDTIFEKIDEVYDVAQRIGATAVLCGGDLFDIPDLAPSIIRKAIMHIHKPIPTYAVVGNHEEYGQNPGTVERTMYGIVEGSGAIRRLSLDNPVILNEGNLSVALTGADSTFDIDKDGRIAEYMPQKPEGADVLIHIVHGFLADHKWMEEIPHTLIDSIMQTQADLVLSGHEHGGYGIIRKVINNEVTKIFCNPGALGRISASLAEMERMPQIAIIDIGQDKQIHIELRALRCARPSDEVLDREKLEREIEQKKNIQNFINQLAGFNVENLDIYHVVDKIADEFKLPEEIRKEAKGRLQQAEEQIAGELTQRLEQDQASNE
jgi:DNA repair exonuclease SbcCD nuclease subunit